MYIFINVTLLSFPAGDTMNKPQKYDAYSISSSVCTAAVDVKTMCKYSVTFLVAGSNHHTPHIISLRCIYCYFLIIIPSLNFQPLYYTGCFKKSFTTFPNTKFLIPQLDEDDQEGRIHFQQEGAPPHYLGEVREYLNTRFPGRWIGTAGGRSAALPKEVTLNHNYPR